MAGHSKWAKIKRDKGANDAKRGAIFTKLGNQIAIAARNGTDPVTNPSLALAIEKARASNMPNANIERSIARVADKNAAQMQEILYEGYGPGGVAVLVECATDNVNRTYPEVKSTFNKRVRATGEEALLTILDAGAEDATEENDETIVYTDQKELAKVRNNIANAGLEIIDAELSYVPNTTVELDDDKQEKVMNLLEALEDLDDVVSTYTNLA